MKEEVINVIKQIVKIIWGFDIECEAEINESGICVSILPEKNQIGFIIGKKGENISALRKLIKVYAVRNKISIQIKPLWNK